MRILLTGATGLVGQGVLNECLRDPGVDRIVVLGRRPCGRTDPRLEEVLVPDFADLAAVEGRLGGVDACLYCAGAVPVGTPADTYRHVTLELTLNVARTLSRTAPDAVFLYISGAHADPASPIAPLRIKGETERALAALPIRTVMLRPGGIQPVDGARSPHPAMDVLYRVAGPLMGLGARVAPGIMTTTAHVGRAMLRLAREPDPPAVVENAEINRLGG